MDHPASHQQDFSWSTAPSVGFGGGKHPDYKMPPSGDVSQFTIRHFAADVDLQHARHDLPSRGERIAVVGHLCCVEFDCLTV